MFPVSLLALEKKLCLLTNLRTCCFGKVNGVMDMEKLQNELEKNLEEKLYSLKNVIWHGLTIDEPLVFEGILNSCFKNPHRKKYPEYLKNRG